ncbi:tyrosine-sulfated glycopeptide receptor 1-like [Pyrus ussuriensis x Pyrus communis]|uniref:Tyrosine-sulfated glycopeptide receptor 1-like n=1 Tax=Pyrus ussuriensis x Pyrus communis TaxID=2448454 RepID=A0A5N5GJZ5_9ROSA|nr:tyrosine-sulfated glycopeptide receptor 1-like [Pyrus ussuriensis x Pyrus communis]
MELDHESDCLTNPLSKYFWVVEKMISLQKEGYSSNQGSRGISRTRKIYDDTNIPPLSPLEGKSKWVTQPS